MLYSKTDPGLVVRVIPMVSYMMDDSSTNVIKKLLVCIMHVYRLALIVSLLLVHHWFVPVHMKDTYTHTDVVILSQCFIAACFKVEDCG